MKNPIAPIVFSSLMLLVSAVAGAQQIGYPPTSSPYLDLEHSQEWTFIAGQYHAHRDPADVGPQSGPLFGVHYEWRAGGPAHLVAEVTRMSSDRRLIDPYKSGEARELGTVSRPLYSADFGLGLSLTGAKSWHHLVPEIYGGVGLISDLKTAPDSGGFRFGTRFAITSGAGIRYVPGGRWQIRADFKDRLYSMGYPEAYYTAPTTGGLPFLTSAIAKTFWTNNPALTLGISRLY